MASSRFVQTIHHVALTTEDMRATVGFYAGVLEMPLIRAMRLPPGMGTGPANIGNPPFEEIRYYFFQAGEDLLLSFFELPPGVKPRSDRDAVGGMQQLAFALEPGAFAALPDRLRGCGATILAETEILPGLFTVNFLDPNGIRLEALCRPDDGSSQRVIASVVQPRSALRAELETLDNDPDWLRSILRY